MAPAWLTTGEGGKVLRSVADMQDGKWLQTRQAVEARMPSRCVAGGLTRLGTDRRIVRGINETDASYAARLVRWLTDHKTRGNAYASLEQIRGYINAPVKVELITNTRDCYGINTDGSYYHESGITWNWDNEPTNWGRDWLLIYWNYRLPFELSNTWEEAPATNLIEKPELMSDAYWNPRFMATGAEITGDGPEIGVHSWEFLESAFTQSHSVSHDYSPSNPTFTTYTISTYVKSVGGRDYFRINANSTTYADFQLSTCTLSGAYGTNAIGIIRPASVAGWYRCQLNVANGTTIGSGGTNRFSFQISDNPSFIPYLGDAAKGMRLSRPQLEENSLATTFLSYGDVSESDAKKWGDTTATLGMHSGLPEQAQSIKDIISYWKPSGVSTWYVMLLGASERPEPDGTWRNNNAGGLYSRNIYCRYFHVTEGA